MSIQSTWWLGACLFKKCHNIMKSDRKSQPIKCLSEVLETNIMQMSIYPTWRFDRLYARHRVHGFEALIVADLMTGLKNSSQNMWNICGFGSKQKLSWTKKWIFFFVVLGKLGVGGSVNLKIKKLWPWCSVVT